MIGKCGSHRQLLRQLYWNQLSRSRYIAGNFMIIKIILSPQRSYCWKRNRWKIAEKIYQKFQPLVQLLQIKILSKNGEFLSLWIGLNRQIQMTVKAIIILWRKKSANINDNLHCNSRLIAIKLIILFPDRKPRKNQSNYRK